MLLRKRLFLALCLLGVMVETIAQRSCKSYSVLASVSWYQLLVITAGIYKRDLDFLNKLGVNKANLSFQSIQIFGNGNMC